MHFLCVYDVLLEFCGWWSKFKIMKKLLVLRNRSESVDFSGLQPSRIKSGYFTIIPDTTRISLPLAKKSKAEKFQ